MAINKTTLMQTAMARGMPFHYSHNDFDFDDDDFEYHRDRAWEFADCLFDIFWYDGEPEDWGDVENALVFIHDNDDNYDDYMCGDLVPHSRHMLRTLRDRGYLSPDGPRSRVIRERWESPVIRKESNTFTENPYGHLVGLEIELTDNNVNQPLRPSEVKDEDSDTKWDCVHDGSVSSGSEFRLRTVTNGDKLLNDISSFCKTMKSKGYKVDDTCGVHMHIDFSKANLPKLKNLIQFYSRYEQFIYDVVGEERKGIRFSQALRKTHRDGELYRGAGDFRFGPLADAMAERTLKGFKSKYYQTEQYFDSENYKYYDGRYSGFNVHSIFLNGTLELRYLRGTLNENYIRSWVMFNLHVVDMFIRNNKIDQNLLHSTNAPTPTEFFGWLDEGAKESYRKLKKSFRYEVSK